MPRPKGSKNKLTIEVKDKLQDLMDNVVYSLNIQTMDTNQKLKLLQIGLQYLLPRLNHISSSVSSGICYIRKLLIINQLK